MPMDQGPSNVVSLDAPIEGWDAYHSQDNMPPTAAILLDNIIPGAGKCVTRGGSFEFADLGTALPVETVVSFNSETEAQLLAASDGGLWQIEAELPPVEIKPTNTYDSDRWQSENFRKADETGILIMCNGLDVTQIYDGTTIRDINITSGQDGKFIGCITFKGREYYWYDNDNAFYYAQAGGYEGELQKFDLGSFTQRGGKLVMITTWTQQDSGDGKDDFLVFVFSTGETIIYQGDDPETAGYFEFVGRYMMAEPLSIRGVSKYGSDTIIMTADGYVALSTIVQEGRLSDVPAFSRLIHSAVTERTQSRAALYGWDCRLFARDGLFVFNVPLSGQTFEQHVMNTVTQRWCRFKNLNVINLEVHQERLFGGTYDGRVLALLEGPSDDGGAINFSCLYAYQYFQDAGIQKHMTAAQIISTHPNPSEIVLTGYADFDAVPTLVPLPGNFQTQDATWSVNPPSPPSPIGSYWDEEFWAIGSTPYTTKGWQNISAYGYAVALLVRFALVNDKVTWRSTGLRYHMTGAQ
jgi:hypothetical protein